MVLKKSFYIRWSAGRSPRKYEVNPGQDPSVNNKIKLEKDFYQIYRMLDDRFGATNMF